jgi:hypothetical protein
MAIFCISIEVDFHQKFTKNKDFLSRNYVLNGSLLCRHVQDGDFIIFKNPLMYWCMFSVGTSSQKFSFKFLNLTPQLSTIPLKLVGCQKCYKIFGAP